MISVARSLLLKGLDCHVSLNQVEAVILHELAIAKNSQLDSWQLIEVIGESENPSFKKSNLEVKTYRLRQKIIQVCGEKNAIKSIRGQCYRLCVDLVVL